MRNATVEVIEMKCRVPALEEIQKLRYKVYVKEMGIPLPSADHVNETLPDGLDLPAIHITARVEGRLTGAVRLNENSVSAGLEGVLQTASLPKPFIYCSRLYVLEEFRGKGVMQELSSACFEQFYERSSAVAICHCYKHLFKLYSRMGFRSYGTPFELPSLEHLGTQTPLVCVMGERGSKQAA